MGRKESSHHNGRSSWFYGSLPSSLPFYDLIIKSDQADLVVMFAIHKLGFFRFKRHSLAIVDWIINALHDLWTHPLRVRWDCCY